MTLRKILIYPQHEKQLRTVSTAVNGVNKEVRRLVRDLIETLSQSPGVGLSAPQIGVYKRVAIIKLGQTLGGDDDELSKPVPLIDPEIISTKGEIKEYDGCLSFPKLYGYTYRAEHIIVSTLNLEGKRVEMALSGLDARVALHEIDHLDGILFIDRIRSRDDLYFIMQKKNGNVLVPIDEVVKEVLS
jgi:peptide deformylase